MQLFLTDPATVAAIRALLAKAPGLPPLPEEVTALVILTPDAYFSPQAQATPTDERK